MTFEERAVLFDCEGDQLIGIIAVPDAPVTTRGVLIVVGGPQYRIGSHRQFVLLARHLAGMGIPCMRFDFRGMGDSYGAQRDFESVRADVGCAIATFLGESSTVETVVLWGLCDGASAACLYAPSDQRIDGLVLLNPWVHTVVGEAKTYLKHYYLQRLFEPDFWRKIRARRFSFKYSVLELFAVLRRARQKMTTEDDARPDLPARMAASLKAAQLPMLLVLSGRDYVAKEFDEAVNNSPIWSKLYSDATVKRLLDADHSFATSKWRDEVADTTTRWVLR